jgi:hypothetical protein
VLRTTIMARKPEEKWRHERGRGPVATGCGTLLPPSGERHYADEGGEEHDARQFHHHRCRQCRSSRRGGRRDDLGDFVNAGPRPSTVGFVAEFQDGLQQRPPQ